jgi:hypothetical protein
MPPQALPALQSGQPTAWAETVHAFLIDLEAGAEELLPIDELESRAPTRSDRCEAHVQSRVITLRDRQDVVVR